MSLSSKPVDPGRADLRFPQSATTVLGPLLTRNGFEPLYEDSTLVTWESERVHLRVYHGRASYELHIEIGQRDGPGRSDELFTLEELVRLRGGTEAKEFRYFASRTQEGITKGLAQIADLLQLHGSAVLRGDPAEFARLRAQRRTWNDDFLREGRLERVRTAAELARQKGDWPALASLYKEIAHELTAVERKRLAYALKRLAKR